ncbi:hypothetical protein BHE90_001201 [Fusarium euwallaceae]|uniref:Clr5 domain-containing protein n=2 Tax=Fusarium solani species complex TaxID=232080 RepID=A0A430M8M7_9HYPO|nr:hypothetical protein CEP51_011762 [Fusarium floridanum]RTE84312.1 hypothetical protein BHE90_001201 [Fusarium euwallaceae]
MTKDWEPLRREIERLYMSEDKPLDEVMRLVRGKYDFIASERSYRTQLRKWGYMKYSTQAFPRPNKRSRASSRPRQQPTATLSNPNGVTVSPGETRRAGNFPAFSATDSGGGGLFFTAPDVSSARVSPPTFNAPSPGTEVLARLFPIGQNDQDAQDAQGMTQLHRSALGGQVNQVRVLLNAGVSVEIQDRLGNTALHYGVTAKNVKIVELILKFGAKIDARNKLGRTSLHLATSKLNLVRALVDHGAGSSIQDKKGDTPLHLILSDSSWGKADSSFSTVNTLLQSGADINKENEAGITPFLQLLDRPYSYPFMVIDTIQSFLQAGGSVHQNLPDGRSPLQIFLSRAQTTKRHWGPRNPRGPEADILRHFLANGASAITPMPSGMSLISAYCTDHEFRWLRDVYIGKELFHRLTPDELQREGNSSLLGLASGIHNWQSTEVGEFIRGLLLNGTDPNYASFRGETPLLFLFKRSQGKPLVIASALSPLLEHGANPWHRDIDGKCALSEAAKRFPEEKFVRTMLKADLDRQKSTHDPDLERLGAMDSEVWDEWQQAARAADWNEAKQLILREPNSFSREVSKILRASALAILAGKHVHLAKDKFQGDDNATELRRKFVAGIFRDCGQIGVVPDASCTDYLVELCL